MTYSARQGQEDHFGYLQQVCKHLQYKEEELRRFLKYYYAQVGNLFEQLVVLRHQLARAGGTVSAETLPFYAKHGLPSKQVEQQEIRQLYHRLVKRYHPDITGNESGKRVLQWANTAYAQRNRHALYELEQSLQQEEGVAVAEAILRVRTRLETLQQSEAWQLKERIDRDKALLPRIIAYVKQEIARLSSQLAKISIPA